MAKSFEPIVEQYYDKHIKDKKELEDMDFAGFYRMVCEAVEYV